MVVTLWLAECRCCSPHSLPGGLCISLVCLKSAFRLDIDRVVITGQTTIQQGKALTRLWSIYQAVIAAYENPYRHKAQNKLASIIDALSGITQGSRNLQNYIHRNLLHTGGSKNNLQPLL